MKNFIIKSNEWYDDLPEPKRFLFFLLFLVGGTLLCELFLFYLDRIQPWPFIIWVSCLTFWRISYTFIKAFGK